jgi:hypothetical protein
MAQSALGRLGALAVAVSFGQCSKSDTLPLITDGDSVRLLSIDTCPDGSGSNGYDDSSWPTVRLPLQNVPLAGACLRKEFDIGSSLPDYRWLDIRLTTGSQVRLNSGKGVTSAEEQGLDWTSGTDRVSGGGTTGSDTSATVVEYTLDLRLFPSLLQPKRNVMALDVPQMRQGIELNATLRRDDGYDSAYVKVVNGPYLVHPTLTSVQLQWETDRSAPSWVELGGGQRYDGGWNVHHAVDVDMLVPGRLYSFYVATAETSALPESCEALTTAADDQLSHYVQRRDACEQLAAAVKPVVADLHTAAAGGTQLKLAIVGDTRSTDVTSNAILTAVARESADVVVHTGDLVASATEADWHGFFAAGVPMLRHTPIVPVVGERDLGPWADRFSQLFALDGTSPAARAYAVDLGVVHLALLDSTADVAGQAAWLDADLTIAESAGAQHIFVVTHLGPWSSGHSGGNAAALATLVPIIRAHHVEAIFSGHDNIYEHGIADGQSYFVTGGAGGSVDALGSPQPTTLAASAVPHYLIVDIEGTSATVLARDVTGATFDTVLLAP